MEFGQTKMELWSAIRNLAEAAKAEEGLDPKEEVEEAVNDYWENQD